MNCLSVCPWLPGLCRDTRYMGKPDILGGCGIMIWITKLTNASWIGFRVSQCIEHGRISVDQTLNSKRLRHGIRCWWQILLSPVGCKVGPGLNSSMSNGSRLNGDLVGSKARLKPSALCYVHQTTSTSVGQVWTMGGSTIVIPRVTIKLGHGTIWRPGKSLSVRPSTLNPEAKFVWVGGGGGAVISSVSALYQDQAGYPFLAVARLEEVWLQVYVQEVTVLRPSWRWSKVSAVLWGTGVEGPLCCGMVQGTLGQVWVLPLTLYLVCEET